MTELAPSVAEAAPLSTSPLSSLLSPLSLSLRRHSIYGTEDRIVLDLGSLYTKIGFSGESHPRHILQLSSQLALHHGESCTESCRLFSKVLPLRQSLHIALHTGAAPLVSIASQDTNLAAYFSRNASLCPRKTQFGTLFAIDRRSLDLELLADRLHHHFYHIFFRRLLADPRQRKVIFCESSLLPRAIKETIIRILIERFQVSLCVPLYRKRIHIHIVFPCTLQMCNDLGAVSALCPIPSFGAPVHWSANRTGDRLCTPRNHSDADL